ncbi:MAG: T9SS type A sorting domain-containing protein [Bacteroidia bacterium]|nr:T9SS type A sorting domain-containing protein [Bacteroidia bacterium]
MRIKYAFLLLSCALLSSSKIRAQFSGAFAPANWGTVAVNSDGQTYTTSAPASIYMTSGNNGSGSLGTNDFTISIPQSGVISFVWSYSTIDGPSYDYPQYAINNGAGILVSGYSTLGNSTQTGTQACVPVNAGDVFRFRMYTADNVFGAATCTFSSFLFTVPAVTITPANPTVCPGNTLSLTGSGSTNYSWSGGISNGVAFTPTASMIYTLTHGPSGCASQKTVSVTYNPPLTISGPTSNICANSSATLIGQGGTTYTWSNGPVASSIVVTPTSNESYTITGVSSQGCNTQGVINLTVDPGLPVLSTTSNPSGGSCPNSTVILTASGATTYTWTGGATTITNGVAFTPTSSGNYVVTGGNSCGTSTAAVSLSVHPLPVIGAVAATGSICSGNSTTINVTGNSITNTITSTIAGPAVTNGVGFTPAVTNTYTAKGTSALGCTATAVATVQVVQTPTLAPTSNTMLLCIGTSATLSATGATGGYTWTTGTSTISTTSSTIQVTPNTTTTYSVTKNSSTCFDTKQITIQVNSLTPTFASANQTLVCATYPTTLGAFGGISYAWYASTAPTVSFSANSNPVVSPSVNTTYTVAASDGTCINTAVVSVSTNPIPTINVIPSVGSLCLGQSATLSANGGNNYTWTSVPATATTSGQSTLAPSFPTAGAYAFYVVGDNQYNCTALGSTVIIVNAAPVLSATPSKSLICAGNTVTLNVTGANLYQWDANANNANTASTSVSPTLTTSYNVTGTLTSTGCSASTVVVVNIYTPLISITSPTNTCLGGVFTLTGSVNSPASGASSSYTWTGPGLGGGPGANANVTPTALTIYTFSAKSTTLANNSNLVCVESKTTSVGIFYNPTITVAPSRTFVCRNEPVNLIANGANTFTWNGGAYSGSTITVSHGAVGTVAYSVAGTDANGCVNDTVFYLKINGCQGIEEFNQNAANINVYPNPNNGEFYIKADSDLHLKLINDLGQVVRYFELNAFNEHQVQVSDLAQGIYFIAGENNQAVTRQKIIVK